MKFKSSKFQRFGCTPQILMKHLKRITKAFKKLKKNFYKNRLIKFNNRKNKLKTLIKIQILMNNLFRPKNNKIKNSLRNKPKSLIQSKKKVIYK